MILYPNRGLYGDLRRMQNAFHKVFDGQSGFSGTYPVVNVYTNAEKVTLTAELPGVNQEDLEITVVGNTVKIDGESKDAISGQEVSQHRKERNYGKFSRTVELPYEVDSGKVEASLKSGVLTLELPIKESEKPRQIKVKLG